MLVFCAKLLESSLPHPQHSAVISLVVYLGAWRVFPQSQIKKVCQKRERICNSEHIFSIRQEIYCRLSIVRCWQIPHIFHIRPPETWGRFKTRGTSSTKTQFDLRSTGRNQPNIHSVFYENIFSDINAISPAINHLEIHLEIIWKTHLFAGCSSINAAPVERFIYIFIHSIDSVIHVFTHSQGLVSGYASGPCVCVCVGDLRHSPAMLRATTVPQGALIFYWALTEDGGRERGPLH